MARPIQNNYSYTIQAAKDSGYSVYASGYGIDRECSGSSGILIAGTIDDCLAYIKQEIIKHDEWRDPGSSRG